MCATNTTPSSSKKHNIFATKSFVQLLTIIASIKNTSSGCSLGLGEKRPLFDFLRLPKCLDFHPKVPPISITDNYDRLYVIFSSRCSMDRLDSSSRSSSSEDIEFLNRNRDRAGDNNHDGDTIENLDNDNDAEQPVVAPIPNPEGSSSRAVGRQANGQGGRGGASHRGRGRGETPPRFFAIFVSVNAPL